MRSVYNMLRHLWVDTENHHDSCVVVVFPKGVGKRHDEGINK